MLREAFALAALVVVYLNGLPPGGLVADRIVLAPSGTEFPTVITREPSVPISSRWSSARFRAEGSSDPAPTPAVYTGQRNYVPGSTVTFFGVGAAAAGAYQPNEPVFVSVQGPAGLIDGCKATADLTGNWQCQLQLNASSNAFGVYAYTARGAWSHRTDTGTFLCAASWYETRLSEPFPAAAFQQSQFVASVYLHIDLCSCFRCGEGAYCISCRRDALNASGYLIRLETGTMAQWVQTGAGGLAEATLLAPRHDGWLIASFPGTESLPPLESRRELHVVHPPEEDSVAILPLIEPARPTADS